MQTDYEQRVSWFHDARFGVFIHWGIYSLLGRGEWVMHKERIPVEEYARLADRFNPRKFDADAWAALAVEAGAKYMVLTTRHHDGFCLYDSKVSDFTSVKTTAGRDFVREFAEACRKAGLKVGFYYSWLDWRFPGFWDRQAHPESAKAMVKQAHDQIRELMTDYGKVDVLWYDGYWLRGGESDGDIASFWEAEKVNAMVRELQPHIIINNRCGLKGDIDTPEQRVVASEPGRAWESCMTMTDGWGYVHNTPIRTTAQLIQFLVMAASGAGNYLLNIGPRPDGSIRGMEADRLRAMGNWLKVNGESIYGSERCPFAWRTSLGPFTARGSTVYFHILRWPRQGEFSLWGIQNKVRRATVLATGQEAIIEPGTNSRLFFRGLPKTPPDRYDTVIKLELDGPPAAADEYSVRPVYAAGDGA